MRRDTQTQAERENLNKWGGQALGLGIFATVAGVFQQFTNTHPENYEIYLRSTVIGVGLFMGLKLSRDFIQAAKHPHDPMQDAKHRITTIKPVPTLMALGIAVTSANMAFVANKAVETHRAENKAISLVEVQESVCPKGYVFKFGDRPENDTCVPTP